MLEIEAQDNYLFVKKRKVIKIILGKHYNRRNVNEEERFIHFDRFTCKID
jgi:hypothetical protein